MYPLGRTSSARRRRLMMAGIALGSLMLGILLRGPFCEPTRPPAEDSPLFKAAILLVNQAEYERAARLLYQLRREYPRSVLVLSHLGIVLDHQRHQGPDAERYFDESLETTGSENAMIAWGRDHPEFAAYLEDFAEKRLELASEETTSTLEALPDEDEERLSDFQESRHGRSRKALHIAEKINPQSARTQLLIAKNEHIQGDFESADRRLSRLLVWADSDEIPDVDGTLIQWDNHFTYHELRGRNATSWANRLQLEGSQAATQKARELILQAEQDLGNCSRYLRNFIFEDQLFKEYKLQVAKLKASVMRGESDIELGLIPEARFRFQKARRVLSGLVGQARLIGLSNPKTQRMARRISDAESRLRSLDSRSRSHPGIDENR